MRLVYPHRSVGDARRAAPVRRRSLDGRRRWATPTAVLCRQLLGHRTDTSFGAAFAQGMREVEAGLQEHFPDNLYGDLDYFAAALLAEAHRQVDPAGHLRRAFALSSRLLALYGRHSPIRFRYAHDFLYGFDWARWVRKAPARRRRIGPFAMDFLRYLQRRGGELLDLIAAGDERYPPLLPGHSRNAFPFSRAPADERRLHRHLAARGLVPVEAWRIDATPRCERDYGNWRARCARQLRLDP